MTEIENIEKAKEIFFSEKMEERLNEMYGKIPEGHCSGCGNCCNESVPTFFAEFLNIVNYLAQNPKVMEDRLPAVYEHYFLELAEKRPCPFLGEDKRCSIYPVRPLTCRVFGHVEKDQYEKNYNEILESNIEAGEYYSEAYGLDIPDEIIRSKIAFCETFRSETAFAQEQKDEIVNGLFMLDSKFLMDEIIFDDMINIGLTSWFLYLNFEEEELGELRIEISKGYQKNKKSNILDNILESLNKSIYSVGQ